MNLVRPTPAPAAGEDPLLSARTSASARTAGTGAVAQPATDPGSRGAEPDSAARPRYRRRLAWVGAGALALLAVVGVGVWTHVSPDPSSQRADLRAPSDEPLSQGEFRLSDAEMRALRI
ncbi:MAG: hypothetical protein K2X74_07835, partial [Acetobacteraceae bacterium]|nr:hypothetical protein [Acetobacteraceae bacterium]